MCGICGIASTAGPPDPGRLAAMSDFLVHRGPDSAGEYLDGAVRAAVNEEIAHRREAPGIRRAGSRRDPADPAHRAYSTDGGT